MPATFTITALSPQWSLDVEAFKTTGTTVYQLIASEPTTLGAAVSALIADANGMKIGKTHPDTTGVPCRKLSPKFADGTRMLFIVTCDHDSTATALENPLNEPTKVSSSSEQLEETFFEDKTTPTAKLARHTNGRPFDELPRRNKAIRVYEIEKNVAASTTDASVSGLENMVNETAVTIGGRACAPKTVLVAAVSLSEQKTLNGVNYKTLKTTARYNPDTWTQKYESLGLVDVHDDPIPDAKGLPVEKPYPLLADGNQAAAPTAKGAEIALEPYATASFTALV